MALERKSWKHLGEEVLAILDPQDSGEVSGKAYLVRYSRPYTAKTPKA